jgi:GAF domain-containing protein
VSDQNGKRPYDEQTLARVLEAAYVLQEHNREAEQKTRQRETVQPAPSGPAPGIPSPKPVEPTKKRERPPAPEDYAVILKQIVETQRQVQAQQLDFEAAIALVAERASEIARADGVGVAMLEGVNVRYAAAHGAMALPLGTEAGMEKSLCAASLRVGHVVRCSDINTEFLVDLQECRRRGIEAMIAAPIFLAGNVAGALELYYGSANAFVEQDVHTCQLMAGLIGEALDRKKGLAVAESAQQDASRSVQPSTPTPEKELGKLSRPKVALPAKVIGKCDNCGSEIVQEEQFCGSCGLPVSFSAAALSEFAAAQSKQAKAKKAAAESGKQSSTLPDFLGQLTNIGVASEPAAESFGAGQLAEGYEKVEEQQELALQLSPEQSLAFEGEEGGAVLTGHTNGVIETPNWTSAAAARDFLEHFAKGRNGSALGRFLKARRGDIYLAVALVLVAIVIRWGIWSGHPVSATANPAAAAHRRPDADLPLYDRLLIKFGLAEAPDPPEYKGNPNTQVWVDVRTGLYYCPGADLYGKTVKGKFSSQRDAQMDQYEPAARKACD